jgi:hypothetical protein
MDRTGKTSVLEGAGAGQWVGWIIIAVILGEAIWGLIVSIMNNLIVPWLGDVMGQSSGLPTSFTQRPYNYPDLFVSMLELCIAGLVAAILNYFLQRRGTDEVKPVRIPSAMAPVEPIRVGPLATSALLQAASPSAPPVSGTRPETLTSTPLVVAPVAMARPVAVVPLATPAGNQAVKPQPLSSQGEPGKSEPAKPEPAKPEPPKLEQPKVKKPTFYNIVGEPVSSDED